MPNEIKKAAPKPWTLSELSAGISAELKRLNGNVSAERAHSVEHHLRGAIRELGYKPTETAEKKATVTELADQFAAALKAEGGEAAEDKHEQIHRTLNATLSNLKAEGQTTDAPKLKEVPKDVPKGPSTDKKPEDKKPEDKK